MGRRLQFATWRQSWHTVTVGTQLLSDRLVNDIEAIMMLTPNSRYTKHVSSEEFFEVNCESLTHN